MVVEIVRRNRAQFGWVMCRVPRPVERLGPRTLEIASTPARDGKIVYQCLLGTYPILFRFKL